MPQYGYVCGRASSKGLCQNLRHGGEASHANRSGPDLYGGHDADHLGKPVLMDAPALRACERLIVLRRGMEKGTNFTMNDQSERRYDRV